MKILHAELLIKDCTAELWLNDIPLAKLGPDAPHNISVPAQMYVVDGDNTLEVIVSPGPEPSRARELGGRLIPTGAAINARVVALTPGEFAGQEGGDVRLRLEWRKQGDVGAPRIERARGPVGVNPGRWRWESVPRLQLDSATVGRVVEALQRIRLSFQRGDPEPVVELARPKFDDGARAYPARPFTQIVEQFRGVVRRYASRVGWAMEPLDPEQFSFRLAAGGRLVECINKDWKATIRSTPQPSGFPFYFPMFIGLAGGKPAVYL